MAKSDEQRKPERDPKRERAEERPAYEAPRIEKKRSVSRATLFSGGGPAGGPGFTAAG